MTSGGYKYFFVDDDGERFEIPKDEVKEAFISGEFYHPLTGHRVYSFLERFVLVKA